MTREQIDKNNAISNVCWNIISKYKGTDEFRKFMFPDSISLEYSVDNDIDVFVIWYDDRENQEIIPVYYSRIKLGLQKFLNTKISNIEWR